MRYTDEVKGPRRLPNIENLADGKIEINSNAKISLNFESKEIAIEDNGKKQSIGKQLIYFVEEN